jgi:Tfp pilus assembly protein PilF
VVYFEHSAAMRDAIAQLLEQAGNFPDAVEFYRQASVLDGDDLGIRERLGNLLYRGGEYAEALSQLRRVLRSPDVGTRTDLVLMAAECELQVGSPAEARRRYDEVTATEPNNAVAWLGVAKSSLRMGELRRAEGGAVKAAAIMPKSAEMQMVLGYVRLKQARFEDAVVCFRRASAVDHTSAVSLSMTGYALQQGKIADAAGMYRKALAIDPKDELALKALAVVD